MWLNRFEDKGIIGYIVQIFRLIKIAILWRIYNVFVHLLNRITILYRIYYLYWQSVQTKLWLMESWLANYSILGRRTSTVIPDTRAVELLFVVTAVLGLHYHHAHPSVSTLEKDMTDVTHFIMSDILLDFGIVRWWARVFLLWLDFFYKRLYLVSERQGIG